MDVASKPEEKYVSENNPLEKDSTTKFVQVKVYEENVDQTSKLFQIMVTGKPDEWTPTESYEHKLLDGGYIDFKDEKSAQQRLNALVVSAMKNNAAFEVVSNTEIIFKDVSIKVDKDKLYITTKKILTDKVGKPGSGSESLA